MTNRLIRGGLSDCHSSPSKGKSGVLDVIDCSATRLVGCLGFTACQPMGRFISNMFLFDSFLLVGWVLRHVNPLGYFMPNTFFYELTLFRNSCFDLFNP